MGQTLTARRKLFTQREPTPIMILTAAFLDEQDPPYHGTWNSRKKILKYMRRDNLLAGQGESYERMRQLNAAIRHNYPGCEPCDLSTSVKLSLNIAENAIIARPSSSSGDWLSSIRSKTARSTQLSLEAPTKQTIRQRWRHSALPQ
ncbi:Uncharacterized protein DBV15_04517 [Temnothorax longispinosus]|uniref:Uncharacterized protein n=1 Tax=Temnothorax longispinosus TaxID=300112 RepID=A0A4V3SAA3_9HYME|nr:Uncharacterized protein DBV15_04517 [Temnothorax longispinosus]